MILQSNNYNIENRIMLHSRFSSNPQNWFNWIYDAMSVEDGEKILEIGAGNGEMWLKNAQLLPESVEVVVSDILDEFVQTAKIRLANINRKFSFEIIDIHRIGYVHIFDKVLANTMLYHCEDLGIALQQVVEALKDSGTFYATTSGMDHLIELKKMVSDFDSSCKFPLNGANVKFCRENGKGILSSYFSEVGLIDFHNSLIITDFDYLIDFILSFSNDDSFFVKPIAESRSDFKKYLISAYKQGYIEVTKSNCMFVAKK